MDRPDGFYKHISMLPRARPALRSRGRGGWRLRAERVEVGVTQQVMARRLGIPAALLSMVEHELIRLPRGFMREYREALYERDPAGSEPARSESAGAA